MPSWKKTVERILVNKKRKTSSWSKSVEWSPVTHPEKKGTASAICWMGLSRKFWHYLLYSAKTFMIFPGHFASFVSKTRDGAGDVIKKCISNMWKKLSINFLWTKNTYRRSWYCSTFFFHIFDIHFLITSPAPSLVLETKLAKCPGIFVKVFALYIR